jgi:hypothetical protein
MAPGFRRDDVWTPVFTGETTFCEFIKNEWNVGIMEKGKKKSLNFSWPDPVFQHSTIPKPLSMVFMRCSND